jgi:hypothetical protein
MNTFEQISHQGELFVSDVIGRCINDGIIFSEKKVNNYFDVGTAQDWFEYNNKPVIFCDIDGTIIKAQSRLDLVGGESYEPLTENIQRLLKQQDIGAQIFFVTAREPQFRAETRQMLYELGFMSFGYIDGLQNSNRILINDYNNANPYPRASAINLKRDSDNLGDFL